MADDIQNWTAPQVTPITDADGVTEDATANVRNGILGSRLG